MWVGVRVGTRVGMRVASPRAPNPAHPAPLHGIGPVFRWRDLLLCGNGGVWAVRPDSPRDRAAALAMGAGLLLLLAARMACRLADAGGLPLPAADGPPGVGGGAGAVAAMLRLRVVLTRRALASRVTVDLLSPEEFDP